MNMNDIIVKKRDGGELTEEEIRWFVAGYTEGSIPDYQASALLMAIYFRNVTDREIFALTEAMKNSGDTVDLSAVKGIKVDKHSTGGVGDKVTLIVGPVAAACGVPIAKMSGRGLGFTGGTIDKLESIPGFRTTLEPREFFSQVERIGISLIGQSGHIAPADKKLYALRDVTGTVENLGLIASSIMSKKLAAGSDAILLDVKCGRGAFMKTQEDAEALGDMMCRIGESAGKRTVAVITDMEQPLGCAVGNSLEVLEAIEVLKGRGPSDIAELSRNLAGMMIYLGGRAGTVEECIQMAYDAIYSGEALAKFRALIEAQGGDPRVIDDPSFMPEAEHRAEYKAPEDGYVQAVDPYVTGLCSQHTGAGRQRKEDSIDPSAGVILRKKTGDPVRKGETLAVFCGSDPEKVSLALREAENKSMFSIGDDAPEKRPLIKTIIGA